MLMLNYVSFIPIQQTKMRKARDMCVMSILGGLFEKHIQKDHIQDNK